MRVDRAGVCMGLGVEGRRGGNHDRGIGAGRLGQGCAARFAPPPRSPLFFPLALREGGAAGAVGGLAP